MNIYGIIVNACIIIAVGSLVAIVIFCLNEEKVIIRRLLYAVILIALIVGFIANNSYCDLKYNTEYKVNGETFVNNEIQPDEITSLQFSEAEKTVTIFQSNKEVETSYSYTDDTLEFVSPVDGNNYSVSVERNTNVRHGIIVHLSDYSKYVLTLTNGGNDSIIAMEN